MTKRAYVFSDAREAREWERLCAIQEEFDPGTFRRLARLGVGPGASCLEVGPGAGSVMRWMCERVGSTGKIVAIDLNPKFVAAEALSNLEIRQADICSAELEPGQFDLVHARYVLLHIHDAQKAFSKMVSALKPGGWLLIEEPDFTTQQPVGENRPDTEVVTRVFDSILKLYTSMGIHPTLGRNLPALFQKERLLEIGSEVHLPFSPGGSRMAKIMKMSVDHLAERLIDTGIPTKKDMTRFIQLSDDPTSWMMYYATISVWGRKGK